MTVVGLMLQHLLAEAIKGVLLVDFMEIRFHFLTSLRAGRQVLLSPFIHYWSDGGGFWPIFGKFLKIIFSVAHTASPFNSFRVDLDSK